jgi:preprotein translocase subunit SecE
MSKKKDKARRKSEEHKRQAAAKAAVDAGEFVTVEEFIEAEQLKTSDIAVRDADKAPKAAKKKKKKSEPKKSHKQAGVPDKPSLLSRLKGYLQGVMAELHRVVWPTRQEVLNSTVIVLVTLIFFAIFAFVIDQISTWAMDVLIGLAAR